jgi:hypothetical protein
LRIKRGQLLKINLLFVPLVHLKPFGLSLSKPLAGRRQAQAER